jgi:PelA/Pel-15E family pectate lyase
MNLTQCKQWLLSDASPDGRPFRVVSGLLFLLVLAFTIASVRAEPITLQRLKELPLPQQAAWRAYLERSRTNAQADAAVVQAEVVARGMTNALKAPSGGDFKLSIKPGDAWYGSDDAKQLADAVLSYQTPTGGWSKHTGFHRGPRQPGMQWTSQNEPGAKAHYVATFDNGSTTEQLHFLARVWEATKREDCRAGVIKGLNYILAAQFPNGGWPQVYPLEGGYHDNITFNDDAMTHVLELLAEIKNGEPGFSLLDGSHRRQAAVALQAGIDCVLRMQIVQDGRKAAWCGQHDALTLQPASARKMEPATLSGLESAHVLRFLMTLTNPAPEVVTSIEAGLQWLEAVQISGLSKTNVGGRTIYVPDPAATAIYWARFYDLANNQPIFPGRDGIVYASYAAMAANNKLGYDFYTTLPGSIVNNGQKKWRKMLAKQAVGGR